jgi:RNA polymerase sigma-70 factor (ECF subfamily)
MGDKTAPIGDAAEHASFLRNLALDLVGVDEAEDVVQDAMTSLLTAPPRQVKQVRAWLSIVVLNRARSVLRSRERRSRREEHAARESGFPRPFSPESTDVEQVLTELLSALSEEQQEILRLHYYEGVSLASAARRMGRSRQAVQRSHATALAELRRRLDARANGDRSRWLGALAPFALRRAVSLKVILVGVGAIAVMSMFALRIEPFRLSEEGTHDVPETSASLDPLVPSVSQEEGRTPLVSAVSLALTGLVFDSGGRPVAGALVCWFALRSEELEERAPWGRVGLLYRLPEEPIDPPSRDSVQTHSDAGGEFCFEAAPADLRNGSVLVVSAEGHRAAGLDLEPEARGPVEIRLERGREVLVRVCDSLGAPVVGAFVHHVAGARVSQPELGAHQRFLTETRATDSSGEAKFIEFAGKESFHAVLGVQRSAPWQGPDPSRVELRLMPTFRIAGSASFPDRDQWGGAHEGEHRIEVAGRSGISWRPLAEARDVDGEFGPLEVPLLSGAVEYRVRLDGAPVAPQELFFPPPSSGELLRFDLLAQKEVDENLIIQDSEQRPIFGARGMATWVSSEGRLGRVTGVSGPAGYLYFGSVPAGSVRYQVSATGYADFSSTLILPAEAATVVVLQKGVSVTGRVTLDESPVHDFEILYKRNDNLSQHLRRSFFDSEDGKFELSLGAGEWVLCAATATEPAGHRQIVRVSEGKENCVELRLAHALLGGGLVLDTAGEPIADARIQPLSGDGTDRTLMWGKPVGSAADGSFELTAFSAGMNTLVVSGAGFADALVTTRASDDGFVDWGEVHLARPQRLTIQVRGYEEVEVDPGKLSAFSVKGFILAPKHFDAHGVVVFESVPPGELQIHVGAGADYARLHLNLAPGEDWSFEVGIGGRRTVSARLLDEEGKPYAPSLWMLAGGNEFGHYVLRMDGTPEAGQFVLGGIGTDEIELVALADDGTVLASKPLDFDGQDTLEVELRIEASPLHIRVIDPSGASVAGASVRIRSTDENRVLSVGRTSTDGDCSLAGAPHEQVLIDVDHPELGRRFGVPIDASVRRHELVLEASGSLTLKVRDGVDPLAEVETRLQTPDGTVLADPLSTGNDGLVRHRALGAGTYRIFCTRADGWPVLLNCALAAGEDKVVEVALRRLADVDLVVLGVDGLPVAGVPVQLTSTEFATDVTSWLAEERVHSDTGLVTNLNGRVRLEGLPNGPYGWVISLPEAESAGAFRLDPGKNVRNLTLAR